MLDADPAHITKVGSVTIDPEGGIIIEGWEGQGCSCRDVVALALVHTIGVLQRELLLCLEAPGKNTVGVA